ncbi:hypothetical protein DEO72_LG8g1077 [Vigna unguiculata]|uniref:Uncharacterized protein n=1 Tax=Vigna unguiculata TaxID=3917 RepID=A0A4D6MPU8_VIGUN|nr:hypothetical protein DEO72_LG8g1077 [Vigna unguiculata]
MAMEIYVHVALCYISGDVVNSGARSFTSIFQLDGAFNGVCFVVCTRLVTSAAMEVSRCLHLLRGGSCGGCCSVEVESDWLMQGWWHVVVE